MLKRSSYWGGFFVDINSYLQNSSTGYSDYLNSLNNGAEPTGLYPFWAISKMNISGSGLAQIAHKNNRNVTHRIEFANNINQNLAAHPPYLQSYYQTGSVSDNGYVTRPIPEADRTQWFMSIAAGGWSGGVPSSLYLPSVSDTFKQYVFSGSHYPLNMTATTSSLPTSLTLGTSGYTGRNGFARYLWAGEKCFVPWNQLRTGNSNAGQYYNKNLVYEIEPIGAPIESIDAPPNSSALPSNLQTRTVVDRGGNSVRYSYTAKYREPFITSKYKPLVHQIKTSLGTPSKTSQDTKVVELQYSYGNDLQGFANKQLNTTIGNELQKYLLGKVKRPYEILRDNYNANLPRTINGADLIQGMIYSEVVYPREIYTYLSGSRSRLAYKNNFWKSDRRITANIPAQIATFTGFANLNNVANQRNLNRQIARITPSFTTTQGYNVLRSEQIPYDGSTSTPSGNGSGSLWPLDSFLYSDGLANLAALGYTAILPDATSLPAGELMMPWYGTVDDRGSATGATYALNSNILSCQYVYTVPNLSTAGGKTYAEGKSPGGSFTLPPWTAGSERKIAAGSSRGASTNSRYPFYDSYDKYAQEVRAAGQDYTLIPEYRMSENISSYSTSDDLLSLTTATLNITGANHDNYNSSQTGFFGRFGSTDFVEYLNPFMQVGTVDLQFNKNPKHFEIKSDAILKMLPYDGFYPVDRTMQIGQNFFTAYNSAAKYQSLGLSISSDVYWRTLLRPYFAPGILYNSIKSGVAVDYPIRRAGRNKGQFTSVGLLKNPLSGCLGDALTAVGAGQIPGNRRKFQRNNSFDFSDVDVNRFMWGDRLPFEAIFNPENYSRYSINSDAPGWVLNSDINEILRTKTVTATDFVSASIDLDVLEDSNQTALEDYKLSVSNFMAAVPHFFLSDKTAADGSKSHMTKFVASIPGENTSNSTADRYVARTVAAQAGKAYMMEIGLLSTDLFNMYSNPYSFGVPTATGSANWDAYTSQAGIAQRPTGLNWPKHRGEFAPFTPPYFYGPSLVRITYVPQESQDVTLAQILSSEDLYTEYLNENGSYFDFSSGSFRDLDGNAADTTGTPPYGWNRAWQNRMDLDASIVDNNAVPTDAGYISPADPNKWVIMPKWECPILDFAQAGGSPYNFSSSIDVGAYTSTTYGMWHQYGTTPKNNQGVYLFVRDVGEEDTEFRLVGDPAGSAAAAATSSITAVGTTASDFDPSGGAGAGKNFVIETTTVTVAFRWDASLAIGSPAKDTSAPFDYLVGCNSLGSANDAATAILNAITLARTSGDIDVSAAIAGGTPTVVNLTADVLGTGMNTKTIAGTAIPADMTVTAFAGGTVGSNTGIRKLVRKTPSWIPSSVLQNGIGSLASLVGFSDDEVMRSAGGKTSWDATKAKRLGELAGDGEKTLSEAVVAIPFYIGTNKNGDEVATAMTSKASPTELGPKIKEFRRSFTKYSLPPSLSKELESMVPSGYPNIDTYINPFAPPDHPDADSYNRLLSTDEEVAVPVVYLLEHSVSLTTQDLADIWQGISPDIGKSAQTQMSSIGHYMPNQAYVDEGESFTFKEIAIAQGDAGFPSTGKARPDLLDVPLPNSSNGMQPKIKWLVFKVKQRGPTDYHTFIGEEVNGRDWLSFENVFGDVSSQGMTVPEVNALNQRRDAWAKSRYSLKQKKSYNWPYDYCSLIELGKLTTTFGFRPELSKEITEWTSEVDLGAGANSSSGRPAIMSNVGNQLALASQGLSYSPEGVMMIQDQSQTTSTISNQNPPADQRGSMFVPYFPNR